jgi:hypothetical protein
MSICTLGYPNIIPVRRVVPIGRILILVSLVLISVSILVIVISANVGSTEQTSSVTAVPILTPPSVEIQSSPSATQTPSWGLGNEPVVVPIPVPMP